MLQVQREIKRHVKFELEPRMMEMAMSLSNIAKEDWLMENDDTIKNKILSRYR